MAEKRMFSNKVTGSDLFLEMPDSTQNLYFHLSMYADDDGFVDKPKSIMRMLGKKEDDLRILLAKNFIIPFESGVIVIKHWRINNYLRSDRYHETIYKKEKAELTLNEKGEYEKIGIPGGIPNGNLEYSISNSNTNSNTNSNNILEEKGVEKETKHKYGEYQKVLLTDKQLEKLKKDYGEEETLKAINHLDSYIQEKGYKSKDHNLTLRRWVFDAIKKQNNTQTKKINQCDDAYLKTISSIEVIE